MRFGDALNALFTSRAKLPTTRRESFAEIITRNDDYTPAKADARALVELYNSNLWVRAIVGKIAKAGASRAWYLETEAGDRVDRHPALDWLKSGTPRLRGRAAIAATLVHLDLAGEAFWAVGQTEQGSPIGYAVIPPHWVTDIPKTDGPEAVFEVQPKNGVIYRIPATQIIHFRDPDPLDPYGRGSSNARPAKVELDSDSNAAKYLDAYFRNSARPDLIVSGTKEAPLKGDDRARAEETWLGRFRGVRNAGRPFFSSGPLEIKEIGGKLRDNQFSEVKAQVKATVAEYYGMPPELLGRLENSNRATIDAADHLFGKHVLIPRLMVLQDTLEPWVAERFALGAVLLRFETPDQEDKAFALQAMQARPGAFTDNEFRELVGRRKLPGAEFDKPRPTPEPMGGPGKPGDKPGDGKEPPPDKPKGGNKAGTIVNAVDKNISPDDIIRVSDAHLDPEVTAEASKILDAVFYQLLETYGEELLGVLGATADFQVNSAVAEWLQGRGSRLMQGIDRTTRDALRAGLVEGAAANESLAQMAARVEQIYRDAADMRAALIGQTEATAVTGFGSLEAARQAGFDSKRWLSSQDQVVRSTHGALHGQTKLLAEPFQSPSGAQAQHPGAFGTASEDINCRCAMRPILSGEVEQRAADLTDGAFEAAWLGMHERVAAGVRRRMADIFIAQQAVTLAALNRLGGANA